MRRSWRTTWASARSTWRSTRRTGGSSRTATSGPLDGCGARGPRVIADVPGMREEFERVGGGAVLNNSPYDVAAAALCLEEAGAVVSDAYGSSLDDRPLLGSGPDFQLSCV